MEGARGLRWRGTEEEGAFARPESPRRCTLPITALRVIPPSSPAIWLAERPSAHNFFKSSTRLSVQVCISGRFWSKNVIGLCSTLPLWPMPRAESRSYARQTPVAVRTLYLVGTNSGDSLPHEMSYLTVIKLQYSGTRAQESGSGGYTWILRFPQQCPSLPVRRGKHVATPVMLTGKGDAHTMTSKVPPGEAAHFICGSAINIEETCHEHRSSPADLCACRSCI